MDPRILELLQRLGQFFQDVRYVPQGGQVPEGFTHTIKFASVASGQDIILAVKLDPGVSMIVDPLLGWL